MGQETNTHFENRKGDHIRIALDPRSQAVGKNGLDSIQLIHEALPEFNFSEIEIKTQFAKHNLSSPFFISSMTAGHARGEAINVQLARLSDRRQILMGVGSQRRELNDAEAAREWKQVRAQAPNALLLGNLGIAQVISTPVDQIRHLLDSLGAIGLFIHLNPLQEALQPEGTPVFREGLLAIQRLVSQVQVPVIIKEVGCGFSEITLKRFSGSGIHAVDISGFGGTHWGRIEGYRSAEGDMLYNAAQTFANWGLSTAESMLNAHKVRQNGGLEYLLWASGGVRNGLEAAKLLAMGAEQVGLAQPFLESSLAKDPEAALNARLDQLEYELKIAMFCTGISRVQDFKTKKVWQCQNS